MRPLFVLLFLASFTIWDQLQNYGHYTGPLFYFLTRVLTP